MSDFTTWRSLVDGEEIDVIPDSGDLHAQYDATALSLSDDDSVETWVDESGNGHDLTSGTSPTYKTDVINGKPVVRFDGVGEFLDVAFSELPQPVTVFMVAVVRDTGVNDLFDSETSTDFKFHTDNDDSYAFFAGGDSNINGSTADINSAEIQTLLADGSDTEFRINGVQDASGNAGGDGLNGLTVGAGKDDDRHAEADIGEIAIYPEDKSGIYDDVEQYLSDKWGVGLS